jgi:hypothetical protein
MFVGNCFEEMMEGYRMSTRRIYLEGLKETDENADKKIYAGNNYSGYNRVSIRRKRSLYVKKLFAGFFSIIMILGLSAFYGSGLVSAHDNAKDNSIRYKYYKSIQIHCGDTLWNIAEENMSDDYESVNDYITEVKKINKLSSDQIQDSQYLMVPYYSYNK